jgi:hypothetical protein
VFVQNVLSVSDICCKRFLSGYCTCFTPMLQEYIRNVSVVLVLCCNKCFHVVICKCVFLDVACVSHKHMLQLYVLNVSSASIVCCIQVFHVLEVESHGRHVLGAEDGARQAVG